MLLLPTFSWLVQAFWLGMLIGISFIATPMKFRAHGLSRAVALNIGQLTFSVFARLEIGLALITAVLAWRDPTAAAGMATTLLLPAIVAAQNGWLLPQLVNRARAVGRHERLPASAAHRLYAGLEALKVVLLVASLILAAGR